MHQQLLKLYEVLTQYNQLKKIFFKTLLWSALSHTVCIIFFIWIGSLTSTEAVSINTYFFAAPIGFMITAIPIAPAGIGVGQAAFYYIFSLAHGSDLPLGATLITSLQIFYFILGLFGAYFYVQKKPSAT